MKGDKKFFRWLRGELNGYYLQSVSYFVNNWVRDNWSELFTYFKGMQFQLDSPDELKNIKTEDMYNIAKFAGITQLLAKGTLSTNLLRMTGSHVENGIEYSERGLWDKNAEIFRFVHIIPDFTADIVSWCTLTQRMTLVPHGQPILGYLYYGETHYDSQGRFLESSVHEHPPTSSVPYIAYYGERFLDCWLMTESHVAENREYSERGLLNPNTGIFTFYNITPDFSEDIVTLATPDLQMSLVPTGQPVLGYIPQGVEVYDTDGNFHPERVSPTPPTDGRAYVEYYGEKFLQLGENYIVTTESPRRLIYDILLLIQRLRYNGASVDTFAQITKTLVGEFIHLRNSIGHPFYVEWFYENDESVEVDNRLVKLTLWQNLVAGFFPQIALTEIRI